DAAPADAAGRGVAPAMPALSAVVYCLPFFFSSRRRHTRSKRDWSSDVCSSDLVSGCLCIIRVTHGELYSPTFHSLHAIRRFHERRFVLESGHRLDTKYLFSQSNLSSVVSNS